MTQTRGYLGLDVGTVRIGVSLADSSVRLAIPYDVIDAESDVRQQVAQLVVNNNVRTIVVGYPRNQSGEVTSQTAYVEEFARQLSDLDAEVVFQDESLTSVVAEQRLKARTKTYSKADIDSEAATIILQDYLEANS